MNENIDLTKILKDCPTGTKLYSKVHGEVTFDYISVATEKPIVVNARPENSEPLYKTFTSKGQLYNMYDDAECVLVPSKDQQDWSKFEAPWYKKEKFDPKTLQPFDRVLVRANLGATWFCTTFSHIRIKTPAYPYQTSSGMYPYCIPYNDDTKNLVGTEDEVPEYYCYWED